MQRCWFLMTLTGCPYVFGPADLSYVDVPRETGEPAAGPAIRALAAQPSADGLYVTMELAENDPNIAGYVTATYEGRSFEILAPDDFLSWDGVRATFVVDDADPCLPAETDLSVRMVSAERGPGPTFVVPVSYAGFGTVQESADGEDVGVVEPPFVVCGSIDGDSDFDRVAFQSVDAGPHTITATWNSTGDLDLFFREDGQPSGGGYGYVQPEVLQAEFDVALSYEVILQFFGGAPPSRWMIEVAPDR